MYSRKKNVQLNSRYLTMKLLKNEENLFCADCKAVSPSWANTKLGVLICINCSLCHRELNSNINILKSIYLDIWPDEILKSFIKINNKISNDFWEYNLINYDFSTLTYDTMKLKTFIRNKYEYRKWINPNDIEPIKKLNDNNILENLPYNINNENNKLISFDKYSLNSNIQNNIINDSKINDNLNIYDNNNNNYNFDKI